MARYQAMCPSCGAFGAPELFLGEVIKREAIAKALRMPHPLAGQVQAYIGLFRPRSRGHSIDRVDALLGQLLEHIEPETVTRSGRTLPAPIAIWQAALNEVLTRRDKLSLPLKDHGYLLEIALSMADKAQGKAERKQEEDIRHRPKTGPKEDAPRSVAEELEAWKRDMRNLGLNPDSLTRPEK